MISKIIFSLITVTMMASFVQANTNDWESKSCKKGQYVDCGGFKASPTFLKEKESELALSEEIYKRDCKTEIQRKYNPSCETHPDTVKRLNETIKQTKKSLGLKDETSSSDDTSVSKNKSSVK